jgi:GDP-L-fucose synthase
VKKLLLPARVCIPAAPQPIFETELLTGPLEPSNEWYAIAKTGINCNRHSENNTIAISFLHADNLYGRVTNTI